MSVDLDSELKLGSDQDNINSPVLRRQYSWPNFSSSSSAFSAPIAGATRDPNLRSILEFLRRFAVDSRSSVAFIPGCMVPTLDERRKLHQICGLFGFRTETRLDPKDAENLAHIEVRKPDEKEFNVLKNDKKSAEKFNLEDDLSPREESDFLLSQIEDFSKSKRTEFVIEGLEANLRRIVHGHAERFGLEHYSLGKGAKRDLYLRKLDPKALKLRNKQKQWLNQSLEEYRKSLKSPVANEISSSNTLIFDQSKTSESSRESFIRYANWNIEWMDRWFMSDSEFFESTSEISDVHGLAQRVAEVIKQIDSDIISIQEGPSNGKRMQLFVDKFLDGRYWVLSLTENEASRVSQNTDQEGDFLATSPLGSPEILIPKLAYSQQQIYILVKKKDMFGKPRISHSMNEYLSQPWVFDVNGDCSLEEYSFTRRPLVIEIDINFSGEEKGNLSNSYEKKLFVVAIHAKSKYINKGVKLWQSKNQHERQKYIRAAVKNRRRIAGECLRLRKAIDNVIFGSESKNSKTLAEPWIIVSGDLNDGPGLDYFEEYYLLGDCVHSLLGSPNNLFERQLYSVLEREQFVSKTEQWTVEFDDFIDETMGKRVLLDHIFVSESIFDRVLRASVAHSVYNRSLIPEIESKFFRESRTSDHRPVYLDFIIE